MPGDLFFLILVVGGFTYAFRYLPIRIDLAASKPDRILSRFLYSTGPAAIATLFVASILPMFAGPSAQLVPLLAGVFAVVLIFRVTNSVVGATLAGSLAHGLLFALM